LGCTNLVKVTIGSKIDSIPFGCFSNCHSLTLVNIYSSNFVGFENSLLKNVTI
jgi:hypothetical protein